MQSAANASELDAYADSYADAVQRSIDFSGQDHETFTRRKALHLLDLTERRLGDPTRLAGLDVGCGVGLLHPPLLLGGAGRRAARRGYRGGSGGARGAG